MRWEIKDGLFEKKHLQVNKFCSSLKGDLLPFSKYSFYIRGSMIEDDNPHVNADIDLYIIHKSGISKEDIEKLLNENYNYFYI